MTFNASQTTCMSFQRVREARGTRRKRDQLRRYKDVNLKQQVSLSEIYQNFSRFLHRPRIWNQTLIWLNIREFTASRRKKISCFEHKINKFQDIRLKFCTSRRVVMKPLAFPLCNQDDDKMPHPRKSISNLSLSEFLSASDLEPDQLPNQLGKINYLRSRDLLPSPLIGNQVDLPKKNTVVRTSQSNPQLWTVGLSMDEPLPGPSCKKQQRNSRNKRNPTLDQISMDFSQESLDVLNIMVDTITNENQENSKGRFGPIFSK